MISVLFAFLTAGLLASSVGLLSTPLRGFVAGLIFISTPDFIREGTNQMADVPLAFFILMTVVLLYIAEKSPQKNIFLALAGASAAFAGWTKNEGLLFLVCLLAARTLSAIIFRQRIWRDTGIFCIGLLPVLTIALSYKFLLIRGITFLQIHTSFPLV
jgi:4-amino-4-deoxy-L-arabinose transferase-like glycosyltransferase